MEIEDEDPELAGEVLPMELLPGNKVDSELDREEVNVAKVSEGEDAGDALEEVDVIVSSDVKLNEVSVLVGPSSL